MLRSLSHFWRRSVAVAAAAAVATAVLTGALVVGDSVEASLRRLTLDRLGTVDQALVTDVFFAVDLAERLRPAAAEPAILLSGAAVHADTRARATQVTVAGVRPGFGGLFDSDHLAPLFEPGAGGFFPPVAVNAALARELSAQVGDSILLRLEAQGDVPADSLLGRSDPDDVLETVRLTVAAVLPDRTSSDAAAPEPGRFGLEPRQAVPLTAFVPLPRLARALDLEGRANALLVAGSDGGAPLAERLAAALTVDDLGLSIEPGEGFVTVASRELVLRPAVVSAVERLAAERGLAVQPILVYLANEIRVGEAGIPYSTVAALPTPVPAAFGRLAAPEGEPAVVDGDGILLNRWAAEELGAAPGDPVTLTYYRVDERDDLATAEHVFTMAGVVEMAGLGADPSLTPEVPGVSDADDMSGWDPPFPVELGRIRTSDEEYWDRYRGAPKAFVALATGQELWRSRFGTLTSMRVALPSGQASGEPADAIAAELAEELAASLPPEAFGLTFRPVKAEGLEAAAGSTDWSGLFLGFSLFLIVSSALLVGLLFRLSVEQRAGELGLLAAVGYPARRIRDRLLGEGAVLAVLGTAAGLALGVLYARALLSALGTWWRPLLGEGSPSFLVLSASAATLAGAAAGALALVLAVVALSVRRLARLPARRLLAGDAAAGSEIGRDLRRPRLVAVLSAVAAAGLLATGLIVATPSPGLFFGLGAALLVFGLALFALWCARPRASLSPRGAVLPAMAAKNGARNPGRSLLAVVLVASACFVLVAVGTFRRDPRQEALGRSSGTGGFELVAESRVPLREELSNPDDLADLGVSAEAAAVIAGTEFHALRVLPGEDASCLNLYRPQTPRVLGVPPSLTGRGGFTFHGTLEEVDDPWSLLDLDLPPETDPETGRPVPVVPALGDEASVTWILRLGLGDDVVMVDDRGERVRLRIVGLLSRSIFQSELLIAERDFVRHFPAHGGYAYFLADTPPGEADEVAAALEGQLASRGLDVTGTADRLASYQAVENLYLATFQALGGLGLLLGTLGLGVVLLRNLLERRGELATLRAMGYRRRTLALLVAAENAFLLAVGLALGAGAGLAAVAPHLAGRGADVPWGSLALTLVLVALVGMAASAAAVTVVLRAPLLPVLKAE